MRDSKTKTFNGSGLSKHLNVPYNRIYYLIKKGIIIKKEKYSIEDAEEIKKELNVSNRIKRFKTINNKKMVIISEVSRSTDIPIGTIYSNIKRGIIKSHKEGQYVYIHETEIKNIIKDFTNIHISNQSKYMIDKVNSFIQLKKGRWISGEYQNGKSMIDVECSEGHRWTTRIQNISAGTWCPECAKKQTILRIKKVRLLRRINKRIQYVKSPQYRIEQDKKEAYRQKLEMWASDEYKNTRRARNNKKARQEYSTNRKYYQDKYKNRYKNDISYRLNERLKSQLRKCLVKDRSMGMYYDLLGYTASQLKDHLESLFIDGMSWDRVSEWHIDHIKPKSWFNLTNRDGTVNEEEIVKCWALSNLQPLWASDNISKGNRWKG